MEQGGEIMNMSQRTPLNAVNRRAFMQRAAALGISVAGLETLLAACGGGGGNGGGDIRWTNWANTGEIQRFKDFTANYNKTHNANVSYNFIPSANNNYFTKIQTELNGNAGPDVFYVGDGDIGKLVANQSIVELTDLLNSDKSKSKEADFQAGLWGAAKTLSGKIYGVPVDCNPLVLWYNKKVLEDAGITTMPADLFEQGKWTREAFDDMIQRIKAKKKYGYVMESSSTAYWAWCTVNGGKVYDKDGYGDLIVQDDLKAMDALNWLTQRVREKVVVYAGSLPKGQGSDLAFISGQTGFIAVGRWNLPTFKLSKGLRYDCVPYPSPTGKIAPAPVALAYMVINKKTKLLDKAFDFLTNFVSKDGQHFRLQGNGNAVPSLSSKELDPLVTEGNDPEHAHYLLDARAAGYALFPAEANTPGLTDDIKTALDPVWLQGKDIKTTLADFASKANPRIKQAMEKIK